MSGGRTKHEVPSASSQMALKSLQRAMLTALSSQRPIGLFSVCSFVCGPDCLNS